MGKEMEGEAMGDVTQTTQDYWRPYYQRDISKHLMVERCAVCGGRSEAYLTNTYYCLEHFDAAMRRDLICTRMIHEATDSEKREIFRKQPDFWAHAKWICEAEGRERKYGTILQKCEIPEWMRDRYGFPYVKDEGV